MSASMRLLLLQLFLTMMKLQSMCDDTDVDDDYYDGDSEDDENEGDDESLESAAPQSDGYCRDCCCCCCC